MTLKAAPRVLLRQPLRRTNADAKKKEQLVGAALEDQSLTLCARTRLQYAKLPLHGP